MHDQNFKNLILDYPLQAVQFFAARETIALDSGVTITPIRQEQLKQRLGDRFRELDCRLLINWPDGRRAALLFVFEEETDPRHFSIPSVSTLMRWRTKDSPNTVESILRNNATCRSERMLLNHDIICRKVLSLN